MMQIIKLFLNDPWITQINDVGRSFSDYVGAEARYTSAFLTHVGKHLIAIFAVAAIIASVCIGLFIGGTISLVIVSSIHYPQLSGTIILSALGASFIIFLFAAIGLHLWLTRKMKAIFREYQTHWTN